MEDQKSWIFLPSSVEYFYSADGKTFFPFETAITNEQPHANKNFHTKTYAAKVNKICKARYIKAVAHNLKICPRWHIGAGYNCWIFCDEIVVK
jgi:hypothetical protein